MGRRGEGGGVRARSAPGRGVPRDPYSYGSSSSGARSSTRGGRNQEEEEEEEEEWETASDDSDDQDSDEDFDDGDGYGKNRYFDEDMVNFLMSGVPQGKAGRSKNVHPDKVEPPKTQPLKGQGKNAKKSAKRNAKKQEQKQAQKKGMRSMMEEMIAGGADEEKIAEMMMASESRSDADFRELSAAFQSASIDSRKESSRKSGASESGSYKVGDNVMVAGGQIGKIAFLGDVEYSRGTFAGLVMGEGQGKNDGMVKGVRYFQCAKGRGLMLKTRDIVKKV